ncbi:MAG: TonB-dependent receptor [Caulobacteraceae bacterium]
MRARSALLAGVGVAALASGAWAADTAADVGAGVEPLVVTARLRQEEAQTVPTSLSVVTEKALEVTSTYNLTQFVQLVPSVNYNSPNPRNTSLTIRGLGSSVVAIAQANDGLEPGVGFYVDQVYHARPATAAFYFNDVARVEVLRGPQGTVFGKNTTAGAVNITTKAPSFTFEGEGELSYGNYNYRQGKVSVSGPILGGLIAGRLSLVSTTRDGTIHNVNLGGWANGINDQSIRAALLFKPRADLTYTLSFDDNRINEKCCTQVFVRVGTSLKPAAQQFPALAAGVGYAPPSTNPYDRLTDIDAALKTHTDDAGVQGLGEWNLGKATVTSVSAWRWWNWDAANDRDYTSQRIQLLQHIPSRQDQYSQELRIASNGRQALEYVAGLYYFRQVINGEPITGYGPAASYWLLPGKGDPSSLLDGYYTDGHTRFESNSYAAFGELTWRITPQFNITGGARYTYEAKNGTYSAPVFGGGTPASTAQTNDKLSILRPQAYAASVYDGDLSGRIVGAYDLTDTVMAYASWAHTGKSGGINMSGLPLNAQNLPALNTAVVRPEKNETFEIGVKSRLWDNRLRLNLDYFDTTVHDYQTNIVDTGPGALRGYLANIPLVKDRGFEVDSDLALNDRLSGHASATYIDGQYVSYKAGPCPLERTGAATAACDLSGRPLTGTPKWAWNAGGEYKQPVPWGEAYLHAEVAYRGDMYGDPADSRYTLLKGYAVVNMSLGLRVAKTWDAFLWARNLTQTNYMQNVTVQAGNSGLVVGTPGDPAAYGVTAKARF